MDFSFYYFSTWHHNHFFMNFFRCNFRTWLHFFMDFFSQHFPTRLRVFWIFWGYGPDWPHFVVVLWETHWLKHNSVVGQLGGLALAVQCSILQARCRYLHNVNFILFPSINSHSTTPFVFHSLVFFSYLHTQEHSRLIYQAYNLYFVSLCSKPVRTHKFSFAKSAVLKIQEAAKTIEQWTVLKKKEESVPSGIRSLNLSILNSAHYEYATAASHS